eukprot:1153571-Prorocentrum_minimum.AAC.2
MRGGLVFTFSVRGLPGTICVRPRLLAKMGEAPAHDACEAISAVESFGRRNSETISPVEFRRRSSESLGTGGDRHTQIEGAKDGGMTVEGDADVHAANGM